METRSSSRPGRIGILIAGWVAILWTANPPGACANPASDFPVVFTQVPVDQCLAFSAREPTDVFPRDWLNSARIVLRSPQGRNEVLTADFSAACDPETSLDASRLLFSAKRQLDSPWSIWEMDLATRKPRQITPGTRNCFQPRYLSSLYTLDSPQPWYTLLYVGETDHWNEALTGPALSLFNVRLDGLQDQQITFHPGNEFSPVQMPDGRVLFASWHQRSPDPVDRVGLFDANLDGTDLALFGASSGRVIQHSPCATEEGLIVFVESDRPVWDGAGQLSRITTRRPHHSYRPITGDPAVSYLSPASAGEGWLLVARRPTHGDLNAALYWVHSETGQTRLFYDNPVFQDIQPRVVRPRSEPDGRSTVVDLKRETGVLYGLNLYNADRALRPSLHSGQFARLRVLEAVSPRFGEEKPSAVALGRRVVRNWKPPPYRVPRRLLGEIPIEADGSFNIEIPADIPVELQALDTNGLALATCRWIWVRPRESRGCIGCHEDPELTPENLFVEAVRRPSRQLTLPPDRRRSLGFREDIFPIVHNTCAVADCHGDPDHVLPMASPHRSSGPEDSIRYAFISMISPEVNPNAGPVHPTYVIPREARNSLLIWHLLGKRTSRPWDHPADSPAPPGSSPSSLKKMPPPDSGSVLSELEQRTFIEWIDLGAPWERTPPSDPSRQTDRLNLP